MKNRILIAYASRHGSTREIAARVAATLREAGLPVDCREMRAVTTLADYRFVVLGAPFYYGRWPHAARRFLGRFGPELADRDVAVFGSGQVFADRPGDEAREQLDLVLRQHDWLHPVTVAMFGGRWDPVHVTGWHRLLLRLPVSPLHVLPSADLRDWAAIDRWSAEVAKKAGARPVRGAAPAHPPASRTGATLSAIGEYIADQQRIPPQDPPAAR